MTFVHLMKNLPVDPVKDFTPIMAAAEPVTALVVNADLPVNSVPELIAYAKANPGKLSYGSSGVGSVFHLTGELFNRIAGVNINPRALSRRSPADAGHRGGSHPAPAHLAVQRAGRARLGQGKGAGDPGAQALRQDAGHAVDDRNPSSIPEALDMVRLLRACQTAAGDLRQLNAEMRKAINAPESRAKIEGQRHDDHRRYAEQFAALQKDGIEKFGEIIKAAGIKPE